MELTRSLIDQTRALGALAKFPGYSEQAVSAIAENIARMCKTQSQVDALIAEMVSGRFDEWHGPETLRNVFEEIAIPREPRAKWLASKPDPIECRRCLDLGVVNELTKPEPCSCAEGRLRGVEMVMELLARREAAREGRRRAKETSDRLSKKALPDSKSIEQQLRYISGEETPVKP